MKKNIFYSLLVVFGLGLANQTQAQVSVNINIGSQPLWGPIGYDYVRYYYMPEIDVYYNVATRKYTYWHKNKWITRSSIPKHYRHVDLYRTYKVVVNVNDPWHNHGFYHRKYGHYAHNHSQLVIRDHKGKHDNKGNRHGHYNQRGKHSSNKRDNGHHGHRR
jgi:hypothetical protein